MRTLECSPDGVFWSDINGDIVYVNKAACEKLGYSKEELTQMNILDFDVQVSNRDIGEQGRLMHAVKAGKTVRIQTRHKHCDGHIIPIEITMGSLVEGETELGFSFARDISKQLEEDEKIKQAYSDLEKKNIELNELNSKLAEREKQLNFLAYHDMLTGLPNRALLMHNLDQLIQSSQNDKKLAVLFIDLDNFKFINDSFGHSKGDMVLVEVCKRIQNVFQQPGQLYRIGGDEFVLLLQDIIGTDQISGFLEKAKECLATPLLIDSFPVYLSCSIGISIYPDHAELSEELLRYADAAMYSAKMDGKSKFRFFNDEIKRTIENRFAL